MTSTMLKCQKRDGQAWGCQAHMQQARVHLRHVGLKVKAEGRIKL